jgi:hypothetical protein
VFSDFAADLMRRYGELVQRWLQDGAPPVSVLPIR